MRRCHYLVTGLPARGISRRLAGLSVERVPRLRARARRLRVRAGLPPIGFEPRPVPPVGARPLSFTRASGVSSWRAT